LERLPEEVLMAYADGALDEAETRRVEAILAADPAEQARLSPYVVTRDVLAGMFCEALTSPVPDRLIGTVLSTPVGIRAQAVQSAGPSFMSRIRELLFPETPGFASAFALGAAVFLIAGAGWLAGHASLPATSPQSVIALDGDAVYADGALRAALDTTPSSSAFEQGLFKVTPVLTFRDDGDHLCRQYALARAGGAPYAGYACRTQDGRWSIAFHALTPHGPANHKAHANSGAGQSQDNGFTPAGAPELAALEGAIDRSIKGDALSGADEALLISNGWNDKGQH
jgi:hypothetical protein